MQTKRKWSDDEKVTEAGIESFPASDPPAHNMPGPAEDETGATNRRTEFESRARTRGSRSIALALGAVGLTALVVWLWLR